MIHFWELLQVTDYLELFFSSSGGFPCSGSKPRGFGSLLGQMAMEENAGRLWHQCQLARGPRLSSRIPQGTAD